MALQRFVCCFSVMIIFFCKACGRTVINTGNWPWQVAIERNGQFLCGGSLITNQWVLTAASCMSHINLTDTVVFLDCHIQPGLNPNEVNQTVEDFVCHHEYNTSTYENDICLLKLLAPVNFTDYIQPICLASESSTFHNETSSSITGFGFDYEDGSFPIILREVNVPIVGNSECQCYYEGDKVITENMICAGIRAGGKDSFWCDRGEPLMVNKESVWVQSGVMNGHDFCSSRVKPGISTRVSQYEKWIRNTVTGMKPGFVTVTSPRADSNLHSNCPKSPDSSGENLIPLTPFTSLIVLLHVFV
ncbi:hypothetical protein ACER0C_001188 [Sarotherodon galilaeus]